MGLMVKRSCGNLMADRRYSWGAGAMEAGDFEAAADLFAQTLEIVPQFAPAAFALAQARLASGQCQAAEQAFDLALQLDPADMQGASLQLARLRHGSAPATAPAAYVRALFDAYAAGFDAHLAGTLQYRAPQILQTMVERELQKNGGHSSHQKLPHVLDLGCGTGLSGAAFRGMAECLSGVDLSRAMVAVAQSKLIYDHLAVADILVFMQAQKPDSANLIVAADVFVYLGDLLPVLQQCAQMLRPGGLLAFTVQVGESDVSLGEDLRFSHSAAHIVSMAIRSGLDIRQQQPIVARQDRGRDVPGLGCLLGKPA